MTTETTPVKFYRFRSMKYLLGEKYQELERRSIYFANPDKLNDPMEGFRDIVWDGDKPMARFRIRELIEESKRAGKGITQTGLANIRNFAGFNVGDCARKNQSSRSADSFGNR